MSDEAVQILILDDDTAVRQSLVDHFEDRGWLPFPCVGAEEALELLASRPMKAALVDVRLGGMSGDAFIRRANRRHPRLVYVICTGSPDYRLDEGLKRLAQVSEHIFFKPVPDLDALAEEVRRLLGKFESGFDE